MKQSKLKIVINRVSLWFKQPVNWIRILGQVVGLILFMLFLSLSIGTNYDEFKTILDKYYFLNICILLALFVFMNLFSWFFGWLYLKTKVARERVKNEFENKEF